MYSIRCTTSRQSFELPGAPAIDPDYHALVQSGATRPEWCFMLCRDGVEIGRVGFRTEQTCPPEFLGSLPAREVFVFGLCLPWNDPDYLEAGTFMIQSAIESVRDALPELLQAVVNAETDDHSTGRRRLFEALGMNLFQEKQGYGWERGSAPLTSPVRLKTEAITEVGTDLYRETLGRVGMATLDRNDAWYREAAGEENWASAFMTYFSPQDAWGWLLASNSSREPIGIVAVAPFDLTTATIIFIGVVPEHRGLGYVDDLLRAGTAAALQAGFGAMLSDADVLNTPMISAFRRNGHRCDLRPWHKWHYRFDISSR